MYFNEERRLWRKGYKIVVGIDEAGRGPLAGPVVAAAFCFKQNMEVRPPYIWEAGIKDSKKLSAKQREEIYSLLKKDPNVEWSIGRVSERVIDKINILEATKLAMQRAVKNLQNNLGETKVHPVDFLIIDGNFEIKCPISQKSIIRADQRVFSVAASSIIAKVSRDKMMIKRFF